MIMTNEKFNEIIDRVLGDCKRGLCVESGGDMIHKFGTVQSVAGMVARQTASVVEMCRGGEYPAKMWDEKIGDSINYLLILRAFLEEE